ncbi:MAG: integrase core domain-containing protein [Chloroflexota bacterium]|nr:integrase core domain-containing protein [Chloroflexota bacterium]
MSGIVQRVKSVLKRRLQAVGTVTSWMTKPASQSPVLVMITDLARSKPQLIAENLLLRQQLVVLNRSVKRPRFSAADRGLFVLLASRLQHWQEALLIVKPETVLRWHREGFRLFWKRKSQGRSREPKIPVATITLIKEMAVNNRLWGAERIRGELLKLGIKVAKRTVQRYMCQARPPRPRGHSWATFIQNHASDIWACDFLQVHDVFFRPLFAFIITELGSRRIVHVGVTRTPTDEWTAQQLREATPFGAVPTYLIRDNDAKYGSHFAAVADGSGIEVLRTPIRAPRANAICERLVGSVRRECLDHLLVVSEAHLRRILKEYVLYFNRSRPHQGIGQRIPESHESVALRASETVIAFPVLGGLHHDYRRAA